MSMDLAVWSTRPFNFPAELPQSDSWERYGEEFSFEGDGWQVVVLSEQSEPEAPVVQKLPGASFVAYVTLEPIGAESDGYAFLEQVVRSVARQVSGVWVDSNGSAYKHDEGSF
jgi:hypothetical protein